MFPRNTSVIDLVPESSLGSTYGGALDLISASSCGSRAQRTFLRALDAAVGFPRREFVEGEDLLAVRELVVPDVFGGAIEADQDTRLQNAVK